MHLFDRVSGRRGYKLGALVPNPDGYVGQRPGDTFDLEQMFADLRRLSTRPRPAILDVVSTFGQDELAI